MYDKNDPVDRAFAWVLRVVVVFLMLLMIAGVLGVTDMVLSFAHAFGAPVPVPWPLH